MPTQACGAPVLARTAVEFYRSVEFRKSTGINFLFPFPAKPLVANAYPVGFGDFKKVEKLQQKQKFRTNMALDKKAEKCFIVRVRNAPAEGGNLRPGLTEPN